MKETIRTFLAQLTCVVLVLTGMHFLVYQPAERRSEHRFDRLEARFDRLEDRLRQAVDSDSKPK